MKVEITGRHKPIKNQNSGLRPSRLAKREVIIGMLSKNNSPRLQNKTAPIVYKLLLYKNKKRPAVASLFYQI